MTIRISPKQIEQFQRKILDWYAVNKRDLPWRVPYDTLSTNNPDPYHILVSEVMSQQTQISRVIPKYENWLKVFPTVFDLAKASNRDVLLHWSGLGYNRRALYLKKCAEELVKRSNIASLREVQRRSNLQGIAAPVSGLVRNDEREDSCIFPQTEKELMALPGIGKYTAQALLCFAFGKQIAVVDTNVRKMILTQFISRHPGKSGGRIQDLSTTRDSEVAMLPRMTEKELEKIAQELLPTGKAYEWNQALMDYASAVLKKEKIPVPKQSKFKDSDRYYRGEIIRYLLKSRQATINELKEHFQMLKNSINQDRLEPILRGLVKDHFLKFEEKRGYYYLL